MAALLETVSVGKIMSTLPKALILGCATPDNPDNSRLIMRTRSGDNLESFYLCRKMDSKMEGFLATYDLRFVLHVSNERDAENNRIVHYHWEKTTVILAGITNYNYSILKLSQCYYSVV